MSKQQFQKAMKHHTDKFKWYGMPTKEAKKNAWKAVQRENKQFKRMEKQQLRYAIT